MTLTSRELYIRFQYSPDTERRKQSDINTETVRKVFESLGTTEWRRELSEFRPTEKNPRRTILEKHLNDYTARNTFDYFIHKDLGGFLRRELDFYIKNEIMHLDDIESESVPKVEQYLSKIKVVRKIAHKVIDFLAQIENFQKKLWLKKKFVVETNYCVTLDRVPEELYPEIIANEAQRDEWVRLFAIDEINGDLAMPGYSVPLTKEFLTSKPFLVLDTQFLSQKFKDSLLASFDDINGQSNGLLIHSENFQSLNLLQKRYREQVKCVYIDPPYNTESDRITGKFIYKNGYDHSTWLTLMNDRIRIAKYLCNYDGRLFCSIDDNENDNLMKLLKQYFGQENFLGTITWEKRTKSQNTQTSKRMLQSKTEYILPFAFNGKRQEFNLEISGQKEYPLKDEIGEYRLQEIEQMSSEDIRSRSTMIFPILGIMPKEGKQWKIGKETINNLIENNRVILQNEKPYSKYRPEDEEQEKFKPFWSHFFNKEVYGTSESGLAILDKKLGFGKDFDTVKPVELIQKLLFHVTDKTMLILDFFAGSGTTAHAVIDLNREDEGNRKYILVEMGEYFNTVMKPRIQKVIYSKDWKDGKPVSREGSSHLFKYIRLESYEDALNNLELKRTSDQDLLLAQYQPFRESYMLSYMLDVESKGSPSLLNIEQFEDPFNYKLNISTGSAGETKPVNVDLVETFNYLIGLTVQHIDHIRGFRVVQGANPKGEKVLVIWRNLKEKSNNDLEEFFRRQEYNPRDMEFDLIYVNGDNNLENIKRPDETWKVRLIEVDFMRLMFDVEDV